VAEALGKARGRTPTSRTLKQSRDQLIAIMQNWSFARSFESFFEDIQQRVSMLPAEQRDAILGRIAQAQAMLGGTDTLTHFQSGSHRTNDEQGGNSLLNANWYSSLRGKQKTASVEHYSLGSTSVFSVISCLQLGR
jgi:hypothetical protein